MVELAATGAKNREIAEALFVTVRTVETHLSNVYRKLGVSGRAEIAAALQAVSGTEQEIGPAAVAAASAETFWRELRHSGS